jgi:hypothetical protein
VASRVVTATAVASALPVVGALLAPVPAAAQGVTSASLAGTITTPAGQPLAGTLVTLTSLSGGRSQETSTNAAGAYSFGLIAPGSYEVRAEALGYRPVVARTLVIGGGERGAVSLVLRPAPPPILTIDTLALGGATSSRRRAGGTRLGALEIDGLPHRFQDLSSIAALAPGSDDGLGSMGLPGSTSVLIVDGVPFYRASHPLARAEQLASPLFTRWALAAVTVHDNAADVESAGGAGGYVSATTRSGTGAGSAAVDGAWSGAPLWSSERLDFDAPSLTSFEAGARGTFVVSPGASQILVAGDVLHQDTPLAPRADATVAASLTGLDPALIAEIEAPSVERLSRYASLVRFDAARGAGSQVFARAGVGYTKRDFEGPGPLGLAGAVALPEESVEFSLAGGWTRSYRPGLIFDVRAGISGSDRSFEDATARPAARLAGSATRLGVVPTGTGDAARVDVVVLPGARWEMGRGTLKLGLAARATKHTIRQRASLDLFYSDGAALVTGRGLARAADSPEAAFTTREVGAYAQYDFELAPTVSGSLGGRLDYELIPDGEATLSTPWLQASGLRNDQYPSRFTQLGARASLTWDPALDGSTVVFGTATVHHGDLDPGALAQLFAQDGSATSTLYAGAGLAWPVGSVPGSASALPTLTLLGPDARAPRSIRGTLGLVQRLLSGWNLHLGAAYQRTDFLMRRRNLNRPVVATATDAFGRDVFGTLQQDGSLVSATGADARRFTAFNEVWALDPDGWSDYWSATAGLEYSVGSTSLTVAYTRSGVTDNWIGGAEGLVDAQLDPALPGPEDWSDGTSDFDAPDRVVATAATGVGPMALSAAYRFRSGVPFTPRYRAGVDANGDGSVRNDVAFVDATLASPLLAEWPCLSDAVGAFAERNSCRGPAAHALDVSMRVRLGRVMGREASLVLDGFDVIEPEGGVLDDALLLVDPTGSITTAGSTVTVPVVMNPDFGRVLYPSSRGRMIRIGFRIG